MCRSAGRVVSCRARFKVDRIRQILDGRIKFPPTEMNFTAHGVCVTRHSPLFQFLIRCLQRVIKARAEHKDLCAQAIRAAGGYVIAQDEVSSVIFGMNAEVIKAGAADQVASLETMYAAVEKRYLLVMGSMKVGAV